MKVEFLDNSGVQNLKQQLEEQIRTCKSFDFASAFITTEGVDILKSFIKKRSNGNSRIIISLYQNFNSKEVLSELKTLHLKSKGKLLIHISKNLKFHWKFYCFEKTTTTIAYIGSANFTSSGLSDAGELTTKLSFSHKKKLPTQYLKKLFNKEFENSISIERFPIELYRSSPFKLKQATPKLHPDIRKLLDEKSLEKGDLLPKVAILIGGYLTQTTVKLITNSKSNWDENGWNYFVCQSKRDYDRYTRSQYMAVIYHFNRKYTFAIHEIKDFTPLKTPDGNYFIAHERVTKTKRESKKLQEQLQELGINYRSRKFNDYILTPKRATILKKYLAGPT